MEQKAKFIIIGLAGVAVICLFLFAQALTSKQQILREGNELKTENSKLASNIEQLNSRLRSAKNELDSKNAELDSAKKAIADLEQKYELAKSSRDELLAKFKSRPQVAPPQEAPATPDAYWANILKAKKELEMQLVTVRDELRSSKVVTEQLQRDRVSLELDVKNLQREKDDLQRQLDYNKKLMDSIAQELVRERNDKIKIDENATVIKNENALISRQLKTLNARKGELENKLKDYEEQKEKLEGSVTDIENKLTDKISQVDTLKKELESIRGDNSKAEPLPVEKKGSVELPPIVVRSESQGEPVRSRKMADLSTKILKIDRDGNFVIIDIGEESGERPGDNYGVYRDGKKIAGIEVIKTSKTVSACDIKKEFLPIKVGDIVK